MTEQENIEAADNAATEQEKFEQMREAVTAGAKKFAENFKNMPIYPYVTEKAVAMREGARYAFASTTPFGKDLVRLYVEHTFNVKVKKVNSVTMPAKSRQLRRKVVVRKVRHKYYVTLQDGYTIAELAS